MKNNISSSDIQSPASGLKAWIPCVGMGIAAFIFNTAEFAPIALLSDITGDLALSEAQAGLLVTLCA